MSKTNGWVKIDKMLVAEIQHLNRPLSRIEAMLSYTVDRDNGKPISIKRYATQWQWSKGKVRKFIKDIHSDAGSCFAGSGRGKRPATPVHYIENIRMTSKWTQNDPLDSSQPSIPEGRKAEEWTQNDPTNKTKTKTTTKTSCSERSSPHENLSENGAIKIPLKDGSDYSLTEQQLNEYREAYPGLDVVSALKKCRQWNIDNSAKRKTKNGIRRHINNWLNTAHKELNPSADIIKDCRICKYHDNGNCQNLKKDGYPEICQAFTRKQE